MLFFSLFFIKKTGLSLKVNKKDRLVLFLRCFLGFLGVVCFFYANNNLPLSNAQILQKLNPFFVILFASLILSEKITLRKALTVLLGFTGAAIIINPTGNFDITPSIIGISAALFGALAYIMIGRLKGRVAGMLIIFYFSVLSLIISLPMMIVVYKAPTLREWIFLIMIGVFAAFGQYFITKAYLNAKAGDVTLFDYTGVILSPILGFLIFKETIAPRVLIGMLIIIIAGYFAANIRK